MIYKARYFPHQNFFEAKLGTKPFYAWRKFWEARSMLIECRLWRIGDGCTTNLWVEPWIPGIKNLPKWSHLLKEGVENLTMSCLIDAKTNSWNEQLVRSTFKPQIVVDIIKIRLNPTPRLDQWIWRANKHDNFSVKSTYKTAQSNKRRDQGESSNSSFL